MHLPFNVTATTAALAATSTMLSSYSTHHLITWEQLPSIKIPTPRPSAPTSFPSISVPQNTTHPLPRRAESIHAYASADSIHASNSTFPIYASSDSPAGNEVMNCKDVGSWTDRYEIVLAVAQFCGRFERQLFGPAPREYDRCECPNGMVDGRSEKGVNWHYVTVDGITTIYILFEVKEGYWYEMDYNVCRNSLLNPIDKCNTKGVYHKQGGRVQNNSLFWRIELSTRKTINHAHHGCGPEVMCPRQPVPDLIDYKGQRIINSG